MCGKDFTITHSFNFSNLATSVENLCLTPKMQSNFQQKILSLLKSSPFIKKDVSFGNKIFELPKKGKAFFIGDLHGDLHSLKKLIKNLSIQGAFSDSNRYIVFLGDYIDRGKQPIKTILHILKLYEKFPKKIILLCGNHEDDYIYRMFREKKNSMLAKIFSKLPLMVYSHNRKFIAVHGGIPAFPNKPTFELQDFFTNKCFLSKDGSISNTNEFFCSRHGMLWNDPKHEYEIYAPYYESITLDTNEINKSSFHTAPKLRGNNLIFNKQAMLIMETMYNINCIIRAHEVTKYQNCLDLKNTAITIFSTGGESPDAYNKYKECCETPYYAKVSLFGTPIEKWEIDKNIKLYPVYC